jgi:hypothetical protein
MNIAKSVIAVLLRRMTTQYFDVKTHDLQFTLTVDGVDMTDVILSTLKRGSAAGFFAEELSARLLTDSLTHVPAKGYDFISKASGRPVECKGFNKNGTDLSPSNMKGEGRKFDKERFDEDARTKDFLVADTSDLANSFSYVVLPGDHVVDHVGHRITARNRAKLFESAEEARPVEW